MWREIVREYNEKGGYVQTDLRTNDDLVVR